MLDIKQIMEIIPQRAPFLMIDRVEELVPGQSCIACKNVCINEPHFAGHFKLEVHIIKQKGPVGVGEAIATVDGKVAAKGELTFAIV